MSALALRFPSVARAPGTDPWDADAFLRWLTSATTTLHMQYSGRFLLAVWNLDTDWEAMARRKACEAPHHARRFDLFEALGAWDAAHRDALLVYVENPFYP